MVNSFQVIFRILIYLQSLWSLKLVWKRCCQLKITTNLLISQLKSGILLLETNYIEILIMRSENNGTIICNSIYKWFKEETHFERCPIWHQLAMQSNLRSFGPLVVQFYGRIQLIEASSILCYDLFIHQSFIELISIFIIKLLSILQIRFEKKCRKSYNLIQKLFN